VVERSLAVRSASEPERHPAIVLELDGRLYAVVVPEFDGDRITALHAVVNPDKLAYFARQTM
jgi:hypothetical protein